MRGLIRIRLFKNMKTLNKTSKKIECMRVENYYIKLKFHDKIYAYQKNV